MIIWLGAQSLVTHAHPHLHFGRHQAGDALQHIAHALELRRREEAAGVGRERARRDHAPSGRLARGEGDLTWQGRGAGKQKAVGKGKDGKKVYNKFASSVQRG